MVGIKLRPYQEEMIGAVRNEWASGNHSTVVVAATGTGKTITFGSISRRSLDNGNGVLVIAHRSELIDQAARSLEFVCEQPVEIEKAESRFNDSQGSDPPLCVASVQTLQGSRLDSFPLDKFKVLIIDEAHHAVSDSYRAIIDKHKANGGYTLGVTATADRADKRGLAEVFDSIAYEYPLARAVAEGYLSPIRAKCIPLKIDLRDVKVSHGDYQAGELGSALDPYLPEIARTMAIECTGRKTVCFLPLVSTAERMAEELNSAGLRAISVSCYDKDRSERIQDFVDGKYDVLTNALLLTEGFDCPPIDCVVMLRPTKSRSMYTQAVGRGTRLSPGKDHLLLLDFLWMTEKHDLARPASLLGKDPKITDKMTDKLESGGEWGLEELADMAERDVVAEREASLAAELERLKKRKKKYVDPLQFATSIQDLDLVDYVPTFAYEIKKPSFKQIETLEKFGIDAENIEFAGQASALIDACIKRKNNGLATPKQIRCIERYGFKHVGSWTFEAANKMISRISINGWRVPKDINPETYLPKEMAV